MTANTKIKKEEDLDAERRENDSEKISIEKDGPTGLTSAGQATKSADSPVDGVPESESILKNELRHNALAHPPKRGLARAV